MIATAKAPKSLREIDAEILRCHVNFTYFVHHHVRIQSEKGLFIEFRLWPDQAQVAKTLVSDRLIVLLKARQLGMSWLVVALAVWRMTFEPGITVLLFSKGQREAKELLQRIRDVINRLPEWLQPHGFNRDGACELELTSKSRCISFASASSGGDSFSAALVIIDEADLIRDLNLLLSGAKPTIDAGGQLIMLSRTDKSDPDSAFKRTYRESAAGKLPYTPIFLPWHSRPSRTQGWYEAQKTDILGRTGWLDELYANYPATAEEALAACQQDKRFPLAWLEQCFEPMAPLEPSAYADARADNGAMIEVKSGGFAAWHGLEVYQLPVRDRSYVFGGDVAEGNPNSDDSVCTILDELTLEEVCVLAGKFEPTVHGAKITALARWYNDARGHVERNHHGHKCLAQMRQESPRPNVLKGRDDKPGWWTDDHGKTLMYDYVADALREKRMVIHSKATFDQLGSLDAIEMNAHDGIHDDRAMGLGLAVLAAHKPRVTGGVVVVTSNDPEPEPVTVVRKFVGVAFFETYNAHVADIEINGQHVMLGEYETADEAALAVNYAHKRLGLREPNRPQVETHRCLDIGVHVAKVMENRR